MPPRRNHAVALIGLAGLLSCGDPTGPRGAPGIQIVAGAGVTDTVYAFLPHALVVEVRDSTGRLPPAGTIVRFQAVVSDFTNETMVGPLSGLATFAIVAAETDRSGRASAQVRLGPRAGPARVVITAPTLGMVDTAEYMVTPGNVFRIAVTPPDTALHVGDSYALSAEVTDMWGNERDDEVSWLGSSTNLLVSPTGQVAGTATGLYEVSARVGTVVGTASLSVVPAFRLIAWQRASTSSIVAMNLDGSDRATLATVDNPQIRVDPVWIPGTSTAIYTTHSSGFQRLHVVNESGVSTPFMATLPTGMTQQAEAAPTADGNWVLFSANHEPCNTADFCLIRTTASGGSPTQLENAALPSQQPAPSPDGSFVAFVRDPFFPIIQVMNAATGEVLDWAVTGSRPSWSPLGTKIAFIRDGRILTVNPDGTGEAVATPVVPGAYDSQPFWEGPIRWSPDAAWIVARYFGRLSLLDVASRTVIPLPFGAALVSGSLR